MPNWLLLLLSLLSFGGYVFTNKRQSKYYFNIRLDAKITLIPSFVIPYLLLLPYLLFTYLAFLNNLLTHLFATSMLIANISATIFWFVFPNGVKRDVAHDYGILEKIINVIYWLDGDTNGFPSGHVFHSIICSYFLSLLLPNLVLLWCILGFFISISTIFTKQHYVLDIVGGVIFAVVPIAISSIIF